VYVCLFAVVECGLKSSDVVVVGGGGGVVNTVTYCNTNSIL
jgi:hypothetical protein